MAYIFHHIHNSEVADKNPQTTNEQGRVMLLQQVKLAKSYYPPHFQWLSQIWLKMIRQATSTQAPRIAGLSMATETTGCCGIFHNSSVQKNNSPFQFLLFSSPCTKPVFFFSFFFFNIVLGFQHMNKIEWSLAKRQAAAKDQSIWVFIACHLKW